MRLLSLKDGQLDLTKDLYEDIPPYAILSHTWGDDEDEVSFKDIADGTDKNKVGFRKIQFCGEQAARDGLGHFWVDTCCIDKANSTELAEAINSMYRWYRSAHKCYTYLSDVSTKGQAFSQWEQAFRESRWFKRGWTLQELIAPPSVEFFSLDGQRLGDKKSFEQQLHEITGIPIQVLRGAAALSEFSVDERTSWAKYRQTKREEDQAYCLLGIFNVHMLPIYGEGRENAFRRLQKKIHNIAYDDGGMLLLSSGSSSRDYKTIRRELCTTVPSSRDNHFTTVRPTTFFEQPEKLPGAIARLVGLFNTCVESLDDFDVCTDLGNDAHHLTTQFEAEKRRFQKWGKTVGFHQGRLMGDYDSALKDLHYSTIEKLLSIIKGIFSNAGDIFPDPKLGPNTLPSRSQARPHQSALPESKRSQFREKARRMAQVELLGKLVRRLNYSIPPGGLKDSRVEQNGLRASSDADEHVDNDLVDDAAYASEFLRILLRIEKEMEAETRRSVATWLLAGYTPNALYENLAPKRVDGTCDWILDRSEFCSWVSPNFSGGSAKILWIHGPLGFGKTILCTRIIEYLSSEVESPIGHFFFSSDFESRGDPYVVLRSWIFQVISHPKAFEVIYERWETQYGRTATQAHVVKIFHDIVHALTECTFILDGLDECSWIGEDWRLHDKDSVAAFLNTITQAVADTKTRIMIVSRDEPEIRQGLPSYVSKYKISSEDVRIDTESYSRTIVNRKLSKKSEITKSDLAQTMANRCSGQFLWLKMQEGSLDNWMNKKQLKEVINETPAGIEHLYDRNWETILNFPYLKRSRAIDLLRWTAFALRPLTISEISDALLINDEYDDYQVDEVMESIDEDYVDRGIVGLCGSLLEVRNTSSEPHVGSRTLHLAHFSVRQFFVSKMAAPASILVTNERLRTSNEAIQSRILGRLCLRYVNYRSVWQEALHTNTSQVRGSFRGYAAGSWYQHFDINEPIDAEAVSLMNTLFDSDNLIWDSWRTWFDNTESHTTRGETDIIQDSPLYYASLLGLVETLRHLIEERKHIPTERVSSGRTAIGVACIKGYSTIVDMLLRAGASIAGTDETGRTLVYLAAWNGHEKLVTLLLGRGADITIPNNYGCTPLNAASDSGHIEVVKVLLEGGADVTTPNEDGYTPLNSASDSGHIDVVKVLLEKGADVMVPNKNGWTPLNVASSNGHIEVVKALLKKGADVTVPNKDGWTPLMSASSNGHIEVVKILLENGADVMVLNKDEWTPLNSASYNGHIEVVKILLENGADVTVPNKDGWTPLNSASSNGHIEVVKILLEKGADVTVPDKDGWTPLMSASSNGHIEVVNVLLEKGADVMVLNKDEWTPLNSASSNGHIEIVKVLLERGADATILDKDGWTPLKSASSNGHIEVVKALLKKGADVTVPSKDGWTPLNSASSNGHIEVVKILLENGADATVPDKNGWTPLNSASYNGHIEVIKILLENGANVMVPNKDGWTPLNSASSNGHIEVVNVLLEKGADITVLDKDGWTPLKSASSNGHIEVVKILLEKGADVTVPNKDGWTPLNWASYNGHIEVVKVLLDKGADVTVLNKDGWTPLNSASSNGHIEVVKILLERGASVTTPSKKGQSPLLGAAANGSEAVVKLLLHTGDVEINAKDTYGQTPLFWASFNGHEVIVKLLLSEQNTTLASAEIVLGLTPLLGAAMKGHDGIVQLLLTKNDGLSKSKDAFGRTPLSLASANGHEAVVSLLLSMDDTDPTTLDNFGLTPLSLAAKRGHATIFSLMLRNCQEKNIAVESSIENIAVICEVQPHHVTCIFCMLIILKGGIYHQCKECDFDGEAFNICQACFARGLRCIESSHEMVELMAGDIQLSEEGLSGNCQDRKKMTMTA